MNTDDFDCVFCGSRCEKIQDPAGGWPRLWECANHPYSVQFWSYLDRDEYNLRYAFNYKYKDTLYRVLFIIDGVEQFRIFEDERFWKEILRINSLPKNFTPENVSLKLPMFLTFS